MASSTIVLPVENLRVPSSAGAVLTQVLDTNLAKWVGQFAFGGGTALHLDGMTYLNPNWFSGGPLLRYRWRVPSTSVNNVTWQIGYLYLDHDGLLSNSCATTFVTTAGDGTAGHELETDLTLNAPASGDRMLFFTVYRSTGDTLNATADLLDIRSEVTIDPTVIRQFVWIPANAFAIAAASGAVLGSRLVAVSPAINPYAMTLRTAQNDYMDARFILPANFLGNLKSTIVGANVSNAAINLQLDMANSAVGGSSNPALTAGTAFNVTTTGVNRLYIDKARTAPISPSAYDNLFLRLKRNGVSGDTNANDTNLFGIMLAYDVTGKNPASIYLQPTGSADPASSVANVVKIDETNGSKWLAQYPGGQDTRRDWRAIVPGSFSNGQTARIRWRANNAGGVAAFQISDANAALGGTADPALSAGTLILSTNAGANLINEAVLTLSGLTASGTDSLATYRRGLNVGDTLTTTTVEILSMLLEPRII